MDISIIVVNYNTREMLLNCLRSIYENVAGFAYQLIVVDNGSQDGSAQAVRDHFPSVRLIACWRNLGFAQANNLAISEAKGRYLGFVNSDAILERGALNALVNFMETVPKAGLACGQLLNSDGSKQNSFSNFPSFASELLNKSMLKLIFPGRYPSKRQDYTEPRPVEAVIGAFFVARKQAVDEVGPMDEDYFLFLEETDWSLRMARAGWGVYHVPQARACHLQGGSLRQNPLAGRVEFYRARYTYFRKHKGTWAARFLKLSLVVRLLLDCCLLFIALLAALGFHRRLRRRLAVCLGLLCWHARLCPEGSGLRC